MPVWAVKRRLREVTVACGAAAVGATALGAATKVAKVVSLGEEAVAGRPSGAVAPSWGTAAACAAAVAAVAAAPSLVIPQNLTQALQQDIGHLWTYA